jgi:diguanylate cyclase (GGDEF)-like protein
MLQDLTVAGDHATWPAFLAGVAGILTLCGAIASVAYHRLRRQTRCLDRALNAMTHGLTMFDRSGRLVVCNGRYIEMYGLSPSVIRPGCTVHEVIVHRIETGSLAAADAHHYAHDVSAALGLGQAVSKVAELPDGRTIMVTRRAIEGGGWVATHDDITTRRQAEAQIAHMAHHDALTDLPNRFLLREELEAALLRARRGERVAVLYLDLDQFKGINDTLGHSKGDELLKGVADRLRSCVRETDTVARLGGDEFAVIQTAIRAPEDAARLARRIRETLATPFELDGHHVITDASIGISIAPDDASDPDHLLKNADMALYGAKSDGRGTFRFFEPDMDARMTGRRAIEGDLRNALAENQFELYYQPLINLERNEICGCEALLRWHHPERGLMAPAEFVPIAEETGLIVPLGEWVLKTACAEAATWPDHITISVNVSPVQFKSEALVLTVIGALAVSGLAPHRLAIEITEAVLMRDNEATLATLHQLRDLGVRIVMDDFGTGYSSLSYLRSFPFDKIKIDRSFINDLSERADAGIIVQAVANLAASLNMTTTAEGAETPGQLEKIRALGCTEMQGYLFSRPKRAADIARMFEPEAEQFARVG